MKSTGNNSGIIGVYTRNRACALRGGLQRRKARVGQSLASTVLPRLPQCMADSSSVAPDIDSELSEAEIRES